MGMSALLLSALVLGEPGPPEISPPPPIISRHVVQYRGHNRLAFRHWPENVSFRSLDTGFGPLTGEHPKYVYYSYPREQCVDARYDHNRSMVVARYEAAIPVGHRGRYTDIHYLPDDGVYFLRSDCGMGHFDGYLGPYYGDPRKVLNIPEQCALEPAVPMSRTYEDGAPWR